MHNNIHAGIHLLFYRTLEGKIIIVGLHIITSRHVSYIHISTSKVCILLGASQQTRYLVLQRYCLVVLVNATRTKHNLIIYHTG